MNRRPLPETDHFLPLRVSPRSRISSSQILVSKPIAISGALNGWHRLPVRLSSSLSSVQSKDRTWLDYGPSQQHSASSKYIRFLNNKRNIKKARVWMIRRLPAIGCGTHLIPFRTQKLNHAPFLVLVWSSAT